MKRIVNLFVSIIVIFLTIISCGQYDDSDIRQRLEKLEGSTINTINQQISAMEKSIINLKSVDDDLTKSMNDLKLADVGILEKINSQSSVLTDLKNEDTTLLDLIIALQESNEEYNVIYHSLVDSIGVLKQNMQESEESQLIEILTITEWYFDLKSHIDSLQLYIDSCRLSDKDWISSTFSTLQMQDSILLKLAKLDVAIGDIDSQLSDSLRIKTQQLSNAIDQAVNSVKGWVNESLEGYYDVATVEAKIAAIEAKIPSSDSISNRELQKIHDEIVKMQDDLTSEYQTAIADAIDTNNGIINKKLSDEISAVNSRIDSEVNTINLKIAKLEGRIEAAEAAIKILQDEITNKLGLELSDSSIFCNPGDVVNISYSIINSSLDAYVYASGENGWNVTVDKSGRTSGTIIVTAPNPITIGKINIIVFDKNKSYYTSIICDEFEPKSVDLGLSVRWAICNLGATKPEEYGDYYFWGSGTYYNGETGWSMKQVGMVWKPAYYNSENYGYTNNPEILPLSNDAANIKWGGNWRMPTEKEFRELSAYCTWTWTEQNGVHGYKIQSNREGYEENYIFLPATGYISERDIKNKNLYGKYWSSTIKNIPQTASALHFEPTSIDSGSYEYRYCGLTVRAVYPIQ